MTLRRAASVAAIALLLVAGGGPASARKQIADIACETTVTAGTGTITLGGAATSGYRTFSAAGVTSGNTVPYQITTGSGGSRKIETGNGVYNGSTLTRAVDYSTDGTGTALTLAGTSTVCVGPITSTFSVVINAVSSFNHANSGGL